MTRANSQCMAALALVVLVGAGCEDDNDNGASAAGSTGDAGSPGLGGGTGHAGSPGLGGSAGHAGSAGGAGSPETGGAAGSSAGEGGAAGGAGLPVVHYTESIVSGGAVWTAATYVIETGLAIEDGTLEIEACSVIRLGENATITVSSDGALKLIGTADCPITITSNSNAPQRGDWASIELYADADGGNNEFDHVVIEYGGGTGFGALWFETGARLAMRNTVVRHSAHFGMQLGDGTALPGFENNTLTANALGPIELSANDVGQLGAGTYDDNDVDSIHVVGGTVSMDQTWESLGVPYVIASDVDVTAEAGSAHLTLAAGTTLEFGENAELSVGTLGGLTAVGSSQAPITFTSAKAAPAPGDWDEIEFYAGSSDGQNRLENVVIEYGGSSGYGLVWVQSGASVEITDSVLTDSNANGIVAEQGAELRSFTSNSMTGNALAPVALAAEQAAELGEGTYAPNGVDVINVSEGDALSTDAVWEYLGVPYLLQSGLAINSDSGGAHLTVEAGSTLLLAPDQSISVGTDGGLTLAGTSAAHVTVTSGKASPAAGDWAEIDIYAESNGPLNVFSFTDISYGGGADLGQVWLDEGAALQLDDVTFSHGSASTCDVYLAGAAALTGSTTPDTCG